MIKDLPSLGKHPSFECLCVFATVYETLDLVSVQHVSQNRVLDKGGVGERKSVF